MIERLILILVLAIQPSWLGALLPRELAMAACTEPVCCMTVEYTTCCGETIGVEQPCPMSGGECFCGATSQDSQPTTPARHSSNMSDLTNWIPIDQVGVEVVFGSTQIRSATRASVVMRLSRSHNQMQSLLGVWRA